jgi:hypothetical protein
MGLSSFFGLHPGEARDVEAVLTRIAGKHETVRMEVERSLVRFDTRLALKNNTVVVAKPPALKAELRNGAFVRFAVPEDAARVMRMEVTMPHFNLSNGRPAFLCKLPNAFGAPPKRKAERFDTSHYTNLELEVPGHPGTYRIVDFSESGCRIMTAYQHPREHFPAAAQLGGAAIVLGGNARLPLASAEPRSYAGRAVGLQFTVQAGDKHRKVLGSLLRSLESAQRDAMHAEAV